MSNYMTCWSSSMAPKIRLQGFACHTKCLGCQCSVTLRCIIPGCQGTIFWQSVKWCRKYWGIVSWVNQVKSLNPKFYWKQARKEDLTCALTAGFVVCWPPARGCCRCSWLVCPQRARGRSHKAYKASKEVIFPDHEIMRFVHFGNAKWNDDDIRNQYHNIKLHCLYLTNIFVVSNWDSTSWAATSECKVSCLQHESHWWHARTADDLVIATIPEGVPDVFRIFVSVYSYIFERHRCRRH